MSQPDTKLRIFFIEMLGEPGTYDASVYDGFVDKDREGLWLKRRYDYLGDVQFEIRSLPRGDSLPDPSEADGFVLGGSQLQLGTRQLPIATRRVVVVAGSARTAPAFACYLRRASVIR